MMVFERLKTDFFGQVFTWQKFLELWKAYFASLPMTHFIRRIRFLLDVADYYLTNPRGVVEAPMRATRLYRYVLRQLRPFANEGQLDLVSEDQSALVKQAHVAFDKLILPRRRFWRAILIFAFTILVGMGASILLLSVFSTSVRNWTFPPDLAPGRPWRVSETVPSYPGTGSMPKPEDKPRSFFFHTQEMDNPWLEIDLGSTKKISRVQVYNRLDCCLERVLPLEVRLSINGTEWETVARRRGTFTFWEARFFKAQARYVRLTSARRTMLHLAAVSIY